MSVTKQEREELSKLFEAVKDAARCIIGREGWSNIYAYLRDEAEYDAACGALEAALTREEPQREPAKPDPAASRGTPVSPLCEPLNGGGSRKNCQTGYAMRCARTDGVVCPENSCDIDDGIYPKPQPAPCQHLYQLIEAMARCERCAKIRGLRTQCDDCAAVSAELRKPCMPTPCQHRDLLGQASALLSDGEFGALDDHAEAVFRRIVAALAQPCKPAPGCPDCTYPLKDRPDERHRPGCGCACHQPAQGEEWALIAVEEAELGLDGRGYPLFWRPLEAAVDPVATRDQFYRPGDQRRVYRRRAGGGA